MCFSTNSFLSSRFPTFELVAQESSACWIVGGCDQSMLIVSLYGESDTTRGQTHRIRIDDIDLSHPFAQLFRIFRILSIRDPETQNPILDFSRLDPSRFRQGVRPIELSDDREGRANERSRRFDRDGGFFVRRDMSEKVL